MHLLAGEVGRIDDGDEAVDLGQSPGDLIVLSSADSELATLSAAAARRGLGAPSLRVANLMRLSHPMSVDLYLDQTVAGARLVVVRAMGGAGYWPYGLDRLRALARAGGPRLVVVPGEDRWDPDLEAYATVDGETCRRLWRYLVEGGAENAARALRFMAHLIGEGDAPPPPEVLPRTGFYWPGEGVVARERLSERLGSGRPVAPLVFYRALVHGGSTAPIDALVAALDREGVAALPVFVPSLKDSEAEAFLDDAFAAFPPAIVLNATAFAVSRIGDAHAGTILDRPGRPVLQVVLAGSSEEAWRESARGLSPRDLTMNVVLPEVDGRILTRAVSFKAETPADPALDSRTTTYRPLADRIAFVARQAAAWVRLARKPAGERRVAIILSNYPNRDGRIANGVGLDTPESAVRLARAMAAAGYSLPGFPDSSATLMARLLAGPTNAPRQESTSPLIPAQASTPIPPRIPAEAGTQVPVREQDAGGEADAEMAGSHARRAAQAATNTGSPLSRGRADGGASGTEREAEGRAAQGGSGSTAGNPTPHTESLPLADYQVFLDTLPEPVRAALAVRWGAPEEDPFFADGAFRLAVHRFGEVVVGIQPARGYNIDPKATYHDPDLVPPHSYLAFYAWLRGRFGADAVVHLGKHGNLEWLPGKALGLSESCWPELALGPTPLVYPFIVNDPGEGAQAKRRASAVIVDHLMPAMTRAEIHGGLAELETLIDEYYLAAGIDRRRRDYLAGEILAAAERHGLDRDLGLSRDDSGGALRALDAHLCELKEMQIRDGLHVLGSAPAGRQRVDTLVAIARAPRSGGRPADASLHRAIAADLGLSAATPARDGGPDGDDRDIAGGDSETGGFDPLDCDAAADWTDPRPEALVALSDAPWRSAGDTVERIEMLAARLIETALAGPVTAAAEAQRISQERAVPGGEDARLGQKDTGGRPRVPPPERGRTGGGQSGSPSSSDHAVESGASGPCSAARRGEAAVASVATAMERSGISSRGPVYSHPDAERSSQGGDPLPASPFQGEGTRLQQSRPDRPGPQDTRHGRQDARPGLERTGAGRTRSGWEDTGHGQGGADRRHRVPPSEKRASHDAPKASSPLIPAQAGTQKPSRIRGLGESGSPLSRGRAGDGQVIQGPPERGRAGPGLGPGTGGGQCAARSGTSQGPRADAEHWPRTRPVLDWIATGLAPALDRSGDAEIDATLTALDGRFVAPGPSGAPTRGRPDVLPTGRNFYSVDVRAVPTQAAWTLGQRAAEALALRYFQDEGEWPRAIAMSAWGTANMRTGGDDIAQALALIGARPVWEPGTGRVTGFAIIPLAELGRPRIDVTFKVSGMFRDAFPGQIDLLDSAIRAVAELEETKSANPIREAAKEKESRLIDSGVEPDLAARQATARIFGAKPGAYGAGMQALIDEGLWESRADFAEAFVAWGGFAYGGSRAGETAAELFGERLAATDAVLHNQDNREHDILDSDDYYQFQGGFSAAVQMFKGAVPRVYHGDHSRQEKPVVRALGEEIARVVRGRAANPKWIAGVMRHGYKGAFEIAATVDYLFAYAAMTDAVGDHHFEALYEAYVADESVKEFMVLTNAPALAEMAARFREAIDRGLWRPRTNSAYDRLSALISATREAAQ